MLNVSLHILRITLINADVKEDVCYGEVLA